ncbi:MAG TPA: FtsQ-type POTRA domain-containing protein [Candidatus Binatia bacterium]
MKKQKTGKAKTAREAEGKKRSRGLRVMFLAFPILALLPAAALLSQEWRPMEKTMALWNEVSGGRSYFSVKEIRVTGARKVRGSEIVASTGLRLGMNMWDVHPREIEAKLARHPWVRGQVVERVFPQRVLVRVEEWVPKAIVVLEKLYYVDHEGYIFKEIEPTEEVNFPFLTGLGTLKSVSDNPMARQKIVEAIQLNELLAANSVAFSEIRFLPNDGLVVYPTSYRVPLFVGWGQWPEKVDRLRRLLVEWKGREERLASMDLRFRDQVVVKLKGGD